jgi:hypothetical protein
MPRTYNSHEKGDGLRAETTRGGSAGSRSHGWYWPLHLAMHDIGLTAVWERPRDQRQTASSYPDHHVHVDMKQQYFGNTGSHVFEDSSTPTVLPNTT